LAMPDPGFKNVEHEQGFRIHVEVEVAIARTVRAGCDLQTLADGGTLLAIPRWGSGSAASTTSTLARFCNRTDFNNLSESYHAPGADQCLRA
jgi:hypothetical protein